jgi:hypothetical protein
MQPKTQRPVSGGGTVLERLSVPEPQSTGLMHRQDIHTAAPLLKTSFHRPEPASQKALVERLSAEEIIL